MFTESLAPPMPQTPPEPETANAVHVQSLKLEIQATVIALNLYSAARILWPDHEQYPTHFDDAPSWVRNRMLRIARRAVASVNEANERSAQSAADQAFAQELADAERDAFVLDRDHSARHLVRAALTRFRERLARVKPSQIAVSIYRTALEQKGRA